MPAAARPLPALALMGLIFFLSAQSDLDTGLGTIDFIARKIGHATIFGALCGLWYWAFRSRLGPAPALIAATAVAVAYAGSDEFHQGFVAGRTGSPVDVAIDTAGIALAALAIRRFARARP